MKKIIITYILLTLIINNKILADACNDLKNRLDKINNFYSSFTQKIIDINGNIIQEGNGYIWVKRPNLFNCHMINPDKIIIISNGKTLWVYNPYIKQITVTWLNDTTINTPFILITHNKLNDWKKYNIKQHGNNFTLTSKNKENKFYKFIINVNKNGIINQLNIIEQGNNRLSKYKLKTEKKKKIDKSIFTFNPPKGVSIDDQRYN